MKALREFIIRLFLREKPKGVMTALPNKDLVDMNIAIVAEKLMRNGIDPNSLKNANQVENLFTSTRSPRKYNNAVAQTHKCFQTFFNIGQNNQLIDDGVGRLSSNNPGFCQSDKATIADALFGMTDVRTFHWAFHSARAATGADVHFPQTQLVAHQFRVQILIPAYGVAAPADHDVGHLLGDKGVGVSEDFKDLVGDVGGVLLAEILVFVDQRGYVENVPEHRKQIFPHATDQFVIDKC